jgi:hypothetical protein
MHQTGFGQKISWEEDKVIPIGHTMSFKDALHVVSTDVFLKLVFPNWAMGLTPRLRRIRAAFEELEVSPVSEYKYCQILTSIQRHTCLRWFFYADPRKELIVMIYSAACLMQTMMRIQSLEKVKWMIVNSLVGFFYLVTVPFYGMMK